MERDCCYHAVRVVRELQTSGTGMAINISLAVQMLALSEGLLMAERDGLDRELALRVMTDSRIGSPMLKARAPLVLDLPADAWFDVGLMHNDIRLALETARELDVPLPSARAADEALTKAGELGSGHRDIAGLFEVLGKMNNERAESRVAATAG
jgi:3-hydroxyisobutyrate dehydrogenase-like beta-hydroxyacid dehydrogenase